MSDWSIHDLITWTFVLESSQALIFLKNAENEAPDTLDLGFEGKPID